MTEPVTNPTPKPFEQTPNPGSQEARRQGCRCPVIDNHSGRGRGGDGAHYGWYMSGDCPLHGNMISIETPSP